MASESIEVEAIKNRIGMENRMRATLDRLERLLEIVELEGISVRRDWLRGVRGGLVRIGRQPILFLDESLSIPEQYGQVRDALSQLDWAETEYGDEMAKLLENEP